MPLEVGGALRFRLEAEGRRETTRRSGDAARKAKDRGHPSSPYGLRRDKEGRF